MNINEIDSVEFVDLVVAAEGNTHLIAERFNRRNREDAPISDFEVEEKLAKLDQESSDRLLGKLRASLAVRLYRLVILITNDLTNSLGDLKPAELAKTHSSLVTAFTNLTAPATKTTFNLEDELADIAREFPDISQDEIRAGFKEMESKLRKVK